MYACLILRPTALILTIIRPGKALAEYMSLVDKLTALSSQWDVRNSAALVLQMAATTLGILCVIGIHNLVHMDDSHKPLYYIVVGMLTFMPALNLFMDLIAAGMCLLHLLHLHACHRVSLECGYHRFSYVYLHVPLSIRPHTACNVQGL